MIRRLARWIAEPEVIGPAGCPILHRWTFLGDRIANRLPAKLLVHRFAPHADERCP